MQQLTHFLSCLCGEWSDRSNTSLENLCLVEEPSSHGVSEIYKLLIHSPEGFVPGFLQKWERDLNIILSEEQRGYILYFAHYSSTASKYQELCYKIFTRWYRVPSLLHKIYPERMNTCWRCGEAQGNMLHIFWSCRKLEDLWSKVRDIIGQLTDHDMGSDPVRYLLHLSDLSKRKYRNSMIVHF